MPDRPRKSLLPTCAALVMLLLAGCAPAPIYKTDTTAAHASPSEVAAAPDAFVDQQVIWGGKVIKVTNEAHGSTLEVLAYPLDKSQRPRTSGHSVGRFIATVAAYLEPLDYPPGSLVTLSGHVTGIRDARIGGAQYALPIVASDQYHRWSAAELRSPWQNIHFGVGVGVGIN